MMVRPSKFINHFLYPFSFAWRAALHAQQHKAIGRSRISVHNASRRTDVDVRMCRKLVSEQRDLYFCGGLQIAQCRDPSAPLRGRRLGRRAKADASIGGPAEHLG